VENDDRLNGRINDRDYFSKFLHERDRRIAAEFEAERRARSVALVELNRRIAHLNDAFARADAVAIQTLTREVYDRDRAEDQRRFRGLERAVNRLIGGLLLAGVVAPTISGVVVYLLTKP
jgi:hypothetical protein